MTTPPPEPVTRYRVFGTTLKALRFHPRKDGTFKVADQETSRLLGYRSIVRASSSFATPQEALAAARTAQPPSPNPKET